jgi:hypothetical protein
MLAVSAICTPPVRGWPLEDIGGRESGGAPKVEEKVQGAAGRIVTGFGLWLVKVSI